MNFTLCELPELEKIPWLTLSHSTNGEPVSPRFKDRYFSCGQGREESEYVYFKANGLPKKWAALDSCSLGEIGFGTGLNFFMAIKKWSGLRCKKKCNYISFERYPIEGEDLKKLFSKEPGLQGLVPIEFWKPYIGLQPGWNELAFPKYGSILHLYIGDALEGLLSRDFTVDTWFYDGFSPGRNPDLWNGAIYAELARHSKTGTSLSTYTSVGAVRRGLMQHGFDMKKMKGFGIKRNMLQGFYLGG